MKWLDSFMRSRWRKSFDGGENLIVVTGMPKSGTTAIASLLAEATGSSLCSDPFFQLDGKGVIFRDDIFSGNISLLDLWEEHFKIFSGKVVKDPNFPLLMDDLVKAMPKAKFVSIVRDPRDNIRSILNRLNLPAGPKLAALNGLDIGATWLNILNGLSPKLAGENYLEVLAWRWRLSAEGLIKHRDLCVEIRYEDFLKNKESEILKACDSLGYKKRNSISHLLDVQFQSKGDSSASWEEFFTTEYLTQINKIVEPCLKEFGYDI